MTMWTSADAINAEIEYRRERVRLTSRTIRRRRSVRKERARVAELIRARRADNTAAEQHTTAEPADHRPAATLPAQRTTETTSKTKQPA